MITVNSYQCCGLSFKTQEEAETYCKFYWGYSADGVKPSAAAPRHQLVWAEDESGNLIHHGVDPLHMGSIPEGYQLYRSEDGLLPKVSDLRGLFIQRDKASTLTSTLGWCPIGLKVWAGRETKAERPVSYLIKGRDPSRRFKTRAEAEYLLKHNYQNKGEVEEVHMCPTTQLLWYHNRDLFGSAGGLMPSAEVHREWEELGKGNQTWCESLTTSDFEDKPSGSRRPILLELPKSYKIQGAENPGYYKTREEAEFDRNFDPELKRALVVGCSEEPRHQLIWFDSSLKRWVGSENGQMPKESDRVFSTVLGVKIGVGIAPSGLARGNREGAIAPRVKSYGNGDRRFRTREEAEIRAKALGLYLVVEYAEEPNSQLIWSERDGVENDGHPLRHSPSNTFYGSRDGLLPNRYHGWLDYTSTLLEEGKPLSFEKGVSPSEVEAPASEDREEEKSMAVSLQTHIPKGVKVDSSSDSKKVGVKSYGSTEDIRFKTRKEADLWWSSWPSNRNSVRELYDREPNAQLVWVERDGVEVPGEVHHTLSNRLNPSDSVLYGSRDGLLPKEYHGWCYSHSDSLGDYSGNKVPIRFTSLDPPRKDLPLKITSWSLHQELGSATLSDGTSITLPMGPSQWVLSPDGKLECSVPSRLRATPSQLKELAESGVEIQIATTVEELTEQARAEKELPKLEVKITAERLKELSELGVKSYKVFGLDGSTYSFKTSIEAAICSGDAIVTPSFDEPWHQLWWKDQSIMYGSGEGLLPKVGPGLSFRITDSVIGGDHRTIGVCLLGDPNVKTAFQGEVPKVPLLDQEIDAQLSPRVVRDGPHGPVEMSSKDSVPPSKSISGPFTDTFKTSSFMSELRTSSFMPEPKTTCVMGSTRDVPSYGPLGGLVRFKTRAEAEVYLSGQPKGEMEEYYFDEANAQLIWVEANGEDVDLSEPKGSNCEVYGSKDGLLPKRYFGVARLEESVTQASHGLHLTYNGSPIQTARVTGYRVYETNGDVVGFISDFRTRAEAEIWSAYLLGVYGNNSWRPNLSIIPLTTEVEFYRQLMWGEDDKGEVVSPFSSNAARVYGSAKGLLPKGSFGSLFAVGTELFTVGTEYYSSKIGPLLLERSEESGSMSWLGAFGFLALLGLMGKGVGTSTKGVGVEACEALEQEELEVVSELEQKQHHG